MLVSAVFVASTILLTFGSNFYKEYKSKRVNDLSKCCKIHSKSSIKKGSTSIMIFSTINYRLKKMLMTREFFSKRA